MSSLVKKFILEIAISVLLIKLYFKPLPDRNHVRHLASPPCLPPHPSSRNHALLRVFHPSSKTNNIAKISQCGYVLTCMKCLPPARLTAASSGDHRSLNADWKARPPPRFSSTNESKRRPPPLLSANCINNNSFHYFAFRFANLQLLTIWKFLPPALFSSIWSGVAKASATSSGSSANAIPITPKSTQNDYCYPFYFIFLFCICESA